MFHPLLFLAQVDEKPNLISVWLMPIMFLMLGGGCWFYAYAVRKNGQDRWWRWIFPYVFMGVALYYSATGLWGLVTDPFVKALVGDEKKVQFSFYAAFLVSLGATVGFVLGQLKGKRTHTDGLSF